VHTGTMRTQVARAHRDEQAQSVACVGEASGAQGGQNKGWLGKDRSGTRTGPGPDRGLSPQTVRSPHLLLTGKDRTRTVGPVFGPQIFAKDRTRPDRCIPSFEAVQACYLVDSRVTCITTFTDKEAIQRQERSGAGHHDVIYGGMSSKGWGIAKLC
jgi:hypothetical protein